MEGESIDLFICLFSFTLFFFFLCDGNVVLVEIIVTGKIVPGKAMNHRAT